MPTKLDEIEQELPLLPGYRVKKVRDNHHKSHFCEFADGVRVVRKHGKSNGKEPLDGFEGIVSMSTNTGNSNSESNNSSDEVPSWMAFDRQVLRFYGRYTEQIKTPIGDKQQRIHNVVLLYYLEDDTVQISEPRQPNTGLVQGTLLRRQRVPSPYKAGKHLEAVDLNVAKSIDIYAKTFELLGCDAFTRNVLSSLGQTVPENQVNVETFTKRIPLPLPSSKTHSSLATSHSNRSFKQFFQHDGQVLRFYCIWDDRIQVEKGQIHRMVLHYFLADDTIEVRELIGQHATNTLPFLRRHAIPKEIVSIRMDGSNLGNDAVDKTGLYTARDLKLGSILNFYGKWFLFCDCDGFTKTYMSEKFGHSNYTPIPFDLYQSMDIETGKVTLKPVPSGLQEELVDDQSELTTLPGGSLKEPKKKGVDENIILKFAAKLKTQDSLDSQRRFVVSYFYVDNTFAVYEKPLPNSGIPGGKFLERSQIKKPGFRVNYNSKDLAIDGELSFVGRTFILTLLDSFTRIHVDQNPQVFPKLSQQQQ